MGRIIAIANQKGGVGKTTTAINLSACLAEAGQKVLAVDFDPQGNATSGLGFEKGYMDKTVYELLVGECTLEECIIKEVQENLDVLPSDVNLAGAEIELLDVPNKESLLRTELGKIKNDYDYVIIDCPPSLSLLTINALTAADTVLVPIQCEYYALEGLSQIIQTVELVKKKLNPQLELEGVVFTMYDARTNLSLQVVENVKNNLNQEIYKTIIPEIAKRNCEGMLLIVSNPVDILTYTALKLSGFPENRVLGSGTVLDTARLKYLIGEHLKVDNRSVHAFIIGEHGDSELAAWSNANVSGVRLDAFCEMRGHYFHEESEDKIYEEVKNSAYEIIQRKQATYYGIAMAVKRICECIIRNEQSILPVSSMMHGIYGMEDVVISMPAIVGKDGVEAVVPIELDEEEQEQLKKSAMLLKELNTMIKTEHGVK